MAYSNGWRSTASQGPVGIWAYDSNRVVIQFNESYDNRTGGPADGGGFDLDSGTSKSILQYNYSHANDGAGFMLAHDRTDRLHAGNVVRYNVSQNDGRRNKYGGIHLWGRITSAEIHNNTIYMAATASAAPRGIDIGNRGIEANDPSALTSSTPSARSISARRRSLPALDPGEGDGGFVRERLRIRPVRPQCQCVRDRGLPDRGDRCPLPTCWRRAAGAASPAGAGRTTGYGAGVMGSIDLLRNHGHAPRAGPGAGGWSRDRPDCALVRAVF